MKGLFDSRGGKVRRIGVFGDENSGGDDLLDALKKLQPRSLGDGHCLRCLSKRCVCTPSQEGKAPEDDEFEEESISLSAFIAKHGSGHTGFYIAFFGSGTD